MKPRGEAGCFHGTSRNVPHVVGADEKWPMSVCVTVSLLAFLGSFWQQLKGLVKGQLKGLSVSIPACPASPLPGGEVFY